MSICSWIFWIFLGDRGPPYAQREAWLSTWEMCLGHVPENRPYAVAFGHDWCLKMEYPWDGRSYRVDWIEGLSWCLQAVWVIGHETWTRNLKLRLQCRSCQLWINYIITALRHSQNGWKQKIHAWNIINSGQEQKNVGTLKIFSGQSTSFWGKGINFQE